MGTGNSIHVLMISQYGVHPFQVGGVEKFIYNILTRICSDDHFKCTLIVPSDLYTNSKIVVNYFMKYHQVRVILVKIPLYNRVCKALPSYIVYPVFVPLWFVKIIKYVAKLRPSIVHIHNLTDVGLSAALSKFFLKVIRYNRALSFIVTVHGRDLVMWLMNKRTFLSKINETLQRLCTNLLDQIVFTNPLTFTYAKRWKVSTKALIIPPGVSLKPCKKTEKTTYEGKDHRKSVVFLCVSRIDREKNLDTLLYAFANLLKHLRGLNKVKLVIIGYGPMYEEVLMLARKLGIADSVELIRRVSEHALSGFFEKCDYVIVPSPYEGFSMVLLEALAHGKPVIAYKQLPALRSIPSRFHKYLGFLTEFPTVGELYRAMINAINNLDYTYKYSSLRRKIVEEFFTWDLIAKKYKAVYIGSINQSQKRKREVR